MSLSVHVRHQMGDFAVDARFESAGGITVLFGPSGVGKTTLINMIAGLIMPTQGHIILDDRVLFDSAKNIAVSPHQRSIGYVFQDARLFPHLSVQQNLRYGRRFSRGDCAVDESAITHLLGLAALLRRMPGTLSGGEKQRVAIGRALLANPKLMLMDEPLAALDQARKDEVLNYIENMRDAFKIPIVYVSHSAVEAERLATQIVHLEKGQVVKIDRK
jgi:molybdate transport system ATP-binding protein